MIDNKYNKGTRFIPQFYAADDGPEFAALTVEEKNQLETDLIEYHNTISNAQKQAYLKLHEKWGSKQLIYSSTWGK